MKCPDQEALTPDIRYNKMEGTVVSSSFTLVHYTFVIVLKYIGSPLPNFNGCRAGI